METGGARFVRKKDFRLRVGLNPDDPEVAAEFAEAVYVIKPTFLTPRLLLEVYQPIIGNVQKTIIGICRNGLRSCAVNTLLPNRPDLAMLEDCGHLVYSYVNGKVVDQQTIMSKDIVAGDDFMVHLLVLEFENAEFASNEWQRPKQVRKSPFQLVENCGRGVEFNVQPRLG